MLSQSLTDTVFGRRPDVAARLAAPPTGIAPAVDGGVGERIAAKPIALGPLPSRILAWLCWAGSLLSRADCYGTIVDADGDAHPLRATLVNIIVDLAQPTTHNANAQSEPLVALVEFAESFRILVESGGESWSARPDQVAWFPEFTLVPGRES